jgi:Flp pilus assembly protein TadB
MAQTKKKRRRKRRGTQGGRIDTKGRSARPRSREEAKARARSKRKPAGPKADLPPTWRNSFIRGLFAAVIFAVLLLVIFKRPAGVAAAFGGFMLAFYVPAGYYIDMTLWRRRERARIREREEK